MRSRRVNKKPDNASCCDCHSGFAEAFSEDVTNRQSASKVKTIGRLRITLQNTGKAQHGATGWRDRQTGPECAGKLPKGAHGFHFRGWHAHEEERPAGAAELYGGGHSVSADETPHTG